MEESIKKARNLLQEAEALLITAGAGMGVDSGLPDFRGTAGFWSAYPPYKELGLQFMSVANPENFHRNPAFGWGFYGHRYELYQSTTPHPGFSLLKQFGDTLARGCFVFTSNVDGHFEKAGFSADQIVECHGSINHLQCVNNCRDKIWSAPKEKFVIEEATMKALDPLPTCPDCGESARPAILMFGDWGWNGSRTAAQDDRYENWLSTLADRRIGIIEMGAGTAIPTVRHQSEKVAASHNGFLIRINPREPELPSKLEGVAIPLGALEALQALL